jgi:hypothetical protein
VNTRRLRLLGILLSVAATVACVSNGREVSPQGLTLEIPDARWEPNFYEALEEQNKKIGVSSLRSTVLPGDDLEVRFWYDHFEMISGVIIRRSSGKWSATFIDRRNGPSSTRQENLGTPKSGWEAAWKRLTDADILTLPDGSMNCKTEALDGIGYVVETNVNRKYRTYRYGNPQLAKCDEAKRILLIENILGEEFQIPPAPK